MILGSADVSSEQKVIGVATFPQFETVDEAVNHPEHGLGEEKLLDILNSQIKTNSMNTLRTIKTKGPTKGALRSEAMSQIIQEITVDGEHQDVVGNKDALTALIDRRMAQLEAEAKEASAVAAEVEEEE